MAHPIYKTEDGHRVPSVTTILGKFKDPGGLMAWAHQCGLDGKDFRSERDAAAGAGTLAHALIEADILKRQAKFPDAADLHVTADEYDAMMEKAQTAFGAYKDWAGMTKLEVIATETPLVSEQFEFGGCPDAVGVAGGTLILLDWKSSNRIYADYLVQVAAYCHLWRNGHPLGEDERPPRLGEPISGVHLLRVGKEFGDFHHHAFPREIIEIGWEQFALYRKAYGNLKRLEKAAG